MDQLRFLLIELRAIVHGKPWRWLTIWFGGSVWINVAYRTDRFLYKLFGKTYPIARPAFFPIFLLCNILGGRQEIHYRAQIGPGLRVLHGALGVVVSGKTVAGERLTLVGGNLIGSKRPTENGDILLGSDVTLGALAVVLGPVTVGDAAKIGAGAVVILDVPPGAIVAGVPAREVKRGN